MYARFIATLIAATLLLAGCGQKGDLYFPKDEDNFSQDTQVPTSQSQSTQ